MLANISWKKADFDSCTRLLIQLKRAVNINTQTFDSRATVRGQTKFYRPNHLSWLNFIQVLRSLSSVKAAEGFWLSR